MIQHTMNCFWSEIVDALQLHRENEIQC